MDNVFTKPPNNAIESVEKETLYTILTYVSWKSAKQEYENEYEKELTKRNKK